MPIVTVVCGILLIALGAWGYSVAEVKSVTALIPAFVGVPLVVAGLLALKESLLKHAMHAAALVGTLGLLAGLGNFARLLVKGTDLTSMPAIATMKMTLICGVFVALCVNSFVQARKRRAAEAARE